MVFALQSCFLEGVNISSLLKKDHTKVFHKLCLGQLCQPQRSERGHQILSQVTNRVRVLESEPPIPSLVLREYPWVVANKYCYVAIVSSSADRNCVSMAVVLDR